MIAQDKKPVSTLLLEDDEDYYIILREFLHEAFGSQVQLEWFARDHPFFDRAALGNYDLALVDFVLHGATGTVIIEVLKTLQPHLPVFLITAWEEDSLAEDARRAGAEGVIQKAGLSPNQLYDLLSPYLVRPA